MDIRRIVKSRNFINVFLIGALIGQIIYISAFTLLSGENSLKQLLLTNNQLVTRLIKFFD